MSDAVEPNGILLQGTIAVISDGIPETLPVRLESVSRKKASVWIGRKILPGNRVHISLDGVDPALFELPVSLPDHSLIGVSIKAQAKVLGFIESTDGDGPFLHDLLFVGNVRIVE